MRSTASCSAPQRAGYSDGGADGGRADPAEQRPLGLIDRFRGRITFPLTDERGPRARVRRARDEAPTSSRSTSTPPTASSSTRAGSSTARTWPARRRRKAGRVVLVEGYTDVIALHQAGVPETVAQMGTALTEQQVDAIARLAPKALLCQDPDSAGQASAQRGLEALTRADEVRQVAHARGRVQDRAPAVQAGPGGRRPGRRAGRDAPAAQTAMPIERFEVERALESRRPSTDELLAAAVRIIAPLPASVLRDELVKFTADRLGSTSRSSTRCCAARRPRARRSRAGPAARAGWSDRGGRQWNGRARARRTDGATASARRCRRRSPWTRARPSPAASRARRPSWPTASRCPTRANGGSPRSTIDDYFSSPTSRKAAAYLRVHLRHPGQPPERRRGARPPGRQAHGRRQPHRGHAGQARTRGPATRSAPPRAPHLAAPALTGTTGVSALAVERQKVLDKIRHRLT